jgi:hypothetical protein
MPGFLTVMGMTGTGGGGATSMTSPPLSSGGGGIGGNSSGILKVTSVGGTGLAVEGGLAPVSTLRIVGAVVSPDNRAGSGVGTPGGSVVSGSKV